MHRIKTVLVGDSLPCTLPFEDGPIVPSPKGDTADTRYVRALFHLYATFNGFGQSSDIHVLFLKLLGGAAARLALSVVEEGSSFFCFFPRILPNESLVARKRKRRGEGEKNSRRRRGDSAPHGVHGAAFMVGVLYFAHRPHHLVPLSRGPALAK